MGLDKNAIAELNAYKVETATYLADKASHAELQSVASGAPRTTYATIALLQAGIPLGDIYSYVTSDGHRYWWNGSAWVDGGIYQSMGIADKSITIRQSAYINVGKNLFDKSTVTTGYIVSSSSGNLGASASYSASDFIAVTPSTTYTRKSDFYMAFYDLNKVFISGFSTGTGNTTFTTPANAYYIRVTVSNAELSTYQLELGLALIM